ncbi:hypothetical protein HIM_02366 [Hirsutella minnesotensis 3608]|nr:hypothetical protein HIM_02366 [Hirsutella minnesotensis 3608]
MDADEFDDDLADEDLLDALEQGPSRANTCVDVTHAGTRVNQHASSTGRVGHDDSVSLELQDLPSDAFSSPEPVPQQSRKPAPRAGNPAPRAGNPAPRAGNPTSATRGLQRTNSSTYRQTTLWGTEVAQEPLQQSQAPNGRVFRADLPREEPSHHVLDHEAMQTWVYPTNLGAIRDYQFSIVKNSLFNNTLVALPTGLGKTFIAATVMLNFYRWTKSAKIVFVAPTKPLVAQQIDACYNIVGIPRSETTLLTGDIPPALRVDEWATRRVFFMTPQTLLNDISHGYADPKSIVLMVIDEAHRAVGEYAYAKATKLIRRFSNSFRVLALTATPGSKIETVQEVVDNLGISHCEIRTEDSIDIRQYVHQRNIEITVLDPSDEMNLVGELFTEALKPLLEKLSSQNIYYGRNPMALTAYGLMQAQKEWLQTRGRHVNQGVQFMMRAIFTVLMGLAHSIKLLNFHGIKPFYDNLVDFRDEQEGKGQTGSKYKRQLIEHPSFQEMMKKISAWLRSDGFVSHPKLTALADVVLNHFMDRGEGSATRVIVFSEYRDSADQIVGMLNKHRPLIKASVFVGQADGKRGEGMKQAQQIQTIDRFKKGDFNVLVATSIGEEGLDIGQVDLIVCYDASASPIRMLQRMGRTGRKRAGNITLLLMRGKEEDQFAKSKDSYEKMQQLICDGSRFNFRFDLSKRIVPRDIRPEVDKKHVDIPIENTQDSSLPEPKKRRAPRGKKMPPKKFHMPDGVETGFQTVSSFLKPAGKPATPKRRKDPELEQLVEVPDLNSVLLTKEELQELNRSYRDLPFNHSVVEETDMPSMTAYPQLQRRLQPVSRLKHGTFTRRCVKALRKMGMRPNELVRHCRDVDTSNYQEIPVKPFVHSDGEESGADDDLPTTTSRDALRAQSSTVNGNQGNVGQKRKRPAITAAPLSEHENSEEGDETSPKRRKRQPLGSKSRRAKQKGKRQTAAGGINSDELGDDCERDSDLMDPSDSDDGADLEGFVVEDNQATSSMMDSQATPSQVGPTRSNPQDRSQRYPNASPQFPASQESDDIPDLATLMGKKQAAKQRSGRRVDSGSESNDAGMKRIARGRRRLVDSDSDE